MEYLLLLIFLVLLTTFVIWSVKHGERPVRIEPTRHLWAMARASSADGAMVHLQAEVIFEVTDHETAASDDKVVALAEDVLRRAIINGRLLSLPGVGDSVPLGQVELIPGVQLERLVVTAADVEITRELRRLVGGP